MTSMENIRNAMQVLYETYENVQKLMDYTQMVAQESTKYRLVSPKFLRYKSDSETRGWLINDFILVFQNSDDPDCESENGWKNAPVYTMEIYLGDKDYKESNVPSIYLSKFEYSDLNDWRESCSPAEHWRFYYPLRSKNDMEFIEKGIYCIGTPRNAKTSSKYWNLKKVTFREIGLIEVNSDNLKHMIFDNFDNLGKKD